jgi:hypothetical protein
VRSKSKRNQAELRFIDDDGLRHTGFCEHAANEDGKTPMSHINSAGANAMAQLRKIRQTP